MDAAAAARRIVASQTSATLATLSSDGHPWASLVAYALLPDGSPVLLVSTFAEHGRNLQADARASLVVVQPGDGDPLERGRVTLAGRVAPPAGDAARTAFLAAVPSAQTYADFEDFAFWVLTVERVRWVGGFALMQTVEPAAYAAAAP